MDVYMCIYRLSISIYVHNENKSQLKVYIFILDMFNPWIIRVICAQMNYILNPAPKGYWTLNIHSVSVRPFQIP